MNQKTQHINIETVIAQFIFMVRLMKWITLELWSLFHWFFLHSVWDVQSYHLPRFSIKTSRTWQPTWPLKQEK